MIKIKRLFKSFQYALKGLVKTFYEEQNLRIQAVAAVVVTVLGAWLGISRVDWLFIILAIGLVLLMELLNSSVERITDVLKPRLNSYVKEIKDIMAAAVMLASILAIIIGLLVFGPYVWSW